MFAGAREVEREAGNPTSRPTPSSTIGAAEVKRGSMIGEKRERIDDCNHRAASVHCPGLVRSRRLMMIVSQLRFNLTLGRFVA